MPFNSTICPRNCPKRRQKAPKTAQCGPAPQNQERAVSWATWLKNEFRGHLVHPQPPTFYGFQAFESPNETPRPPYQWSLGAAGGPASPRTMGANGGSTRVPGAKKMIFFKVVPRPLGMLKQVFLARFEPVVARFGPRKSQNALKMGHFGTKSGSKMGQKGLYSKVIVAHLGCPNKCFWPVLSPLWRVLGHGKSQNALKMGRFGTKSGSKMGQKRLFSKVMPYHLGCPNKCFGPVLIPWWRVLGHGKSQNAFKMGRFGSKNGSKMGQKKRFLKGDRGPFGMLEQVFLTRLEPVVPRFGPRKIPIWLEKGPFWDEKKCQKWVKNALF